MRPINWFFSLLILLSAFCWNSMANDDLLHQQALQGIDLAAALEYEKAITVFDQLIQADPENPRGYFLKSAAYFWMFSADMHNQKIGDAFKEISYQAVEVAKKRLEENEQDINALFYLGGAYGSLGRYYGMTYSYLKAYWYGKKGVNYLETVLEMDSTYYDAYLGMGIYHYLADVLPKFVKVLSFILGIEGDRALGIKQLQLAGERGIYAKTEALFFLGAIYTYREREYSKALMIWNDLLRMYPDNPGVLIHLGRCYANMGYCQQALNIYQSILTGTDIEQRLPLSSIHYQTGTVQFRMNDFQNAIQSFETAAATDTLYSGVHRWTYPWTLYHLGQIHEITGSLERAQYYYRLITDEESEHAYERAKERLKKPLMEKEIRIMIGKNYINCHEYEQARVHFEELLKHLNMQNNLEDKESIYEVQYHLGDIAYREGRTQEAIAIFSVIISDPSLRDQGIKGWCYYQRANCYRLSGDLKKAEADFRKASEFNDEELKENIDRAKNY